MRQAAPNPGMDIKWFVIRAAQFLMIEQIRDVIQEPMEGLCIDGFKRCARQGKLGHHRLVRPASKDLITAFSAEEGIAASIRCRFTQEKPRDTDGISVRTYHCSRRGIDIG